METIGPGYRSAMIAESARMAFRNLRLNRKRSFLTMLGVMIGVASIIALVSLITAATHSINRTFEELGSDSLLIYTFGSGSRKGLTEEDLAALSAVEGVDLVSPAVSVEGKAFYEGTLVQDAPAEGKNAGFFDKNPKLLVAGRKMNRLDEEERSRVCWISRRVSAQLMGGKNPIGVTVTINGIPFTVAGVIAPETDMSSSSMINEYTAFIIPYTTAMSMKQVNYIEMATLYLKRNTLHKPVADEVEAFMKQAFTDRNSYSINDMKAYETSLNSLIGMMSILLVGTASISLLVGGIGIMNMMLTSVSERTVEIGLKKAVGAYAWVIQLQFLTESVILSLVGGGIGILAGFLISVIVCDAMGVSFVLSLSAILLGVGFSLIVGLIFGWAPAKTASKMNPIDALRAVT